jgi:hypothetical protein
MAQKPLQRKVFSDGERRGARKKINFQREKSVAAQAKKQPM